MKQSVRPNSIKWNLTWVPQNNCTGMEWGATHSRISMWCHVAVKNSPLTQYPYLENSDGHSSLYQPGHTLEYDTEFSGPSQENDSTIRNSSRTKKATLKNQSWRYLKRSFQKTSRLEVRVNLFSGTKKKLQPFWQMVFSLTVIVSLLISHVLLSYGLAALQ